MKKIAAYVTQDGAMFSSHDEAVRHADNTYGNLLTSIARELCQLDKYQKAIDWLDNENNQTLVTTLRHLRKDRDFVSLPEEK